MSRFVRRAFLCGYDNYSDTGYEMSNHLHDVLRAEAPEAFLLKDDEVIARWHQLYLKRIECRKYVEGYPLDEMESANLNESFVTWRERLFDISWFMRALNEPIARQANLEDRCTSKFWAGFMLLQNMHFRPPWQSEIRFKSQALVGDEAILTCMVYVDLNPVRAQMADLPEESDYTSIKKRIRAAADSKTAEGLADLAQSP